MYVLFGQGQARFIWPGAGWRRNREADPVSLLEGQVRHGILYTNPINTCFSVAQFDLKSSKRALNTSFLSDNFPTHNAKPMSQFITSDYSIHRIRVCTSFTRFWNIFSSMYCTFSLQLYVMRYSQQKVPYVVSHLCLISRNQSVINTWGGF